MNQPKNNSYQCLFLLVLAFLSTVLISGCLDFGKEEETTHPTSLQVLQCRKLMYLNPNLDIKPLGFKLLGSGIDDAIWLKFRTNAKSLNQ
ncbi:MAG TPA: hypothetical protein VHY08_16685, partial [Bacillota bacterium]|nr:hypothetical protein [Bacillota bacterium]